MNESDSQDLATTIEVVAGNPTLEELALIVAVLGESVTTAKSTLTETNWARGSQLLRDARSPVGLKWRADFKGEI
jgi:hypothetical protein